MFFRPGSVSLPTEATLKVSTFSKEPLRKKLEFWSGHFCVSNRGLVCLPVLQLLFPTKKKWSEFQENRIWSFFACQRSILVFQNLNIVHKSDKIFQKQRGIIEFFGLSTGPQNSRFLFKRDFFVWYLRWRSRYMKIIPFPEVYSFSVRIETHCIPHIDPVIVAAVLIATRRYRSQHAQNALQRAGVCVEIAILTF